MKNGLFEANFYIELKLIHFFTKLQSLNFNFQFCLKNMVQFRFLKIEKLCFCGYFRPIIMFLWIFLTKLWIPEKSPLQSCSVLFSVSADNVGLAD